MRTNRERAHGPGVGITEVERVEGSWVVSAAMTSVVNATLDWDIAAN